MDFLKKLLLFSFFVGMVSLGSSLYGMQDQSGQVGIEREDEEVELRSETPLAAIFDLGQFGGLAIPKELFIIKDLMLMKNEKAQKIADELVEQLTKLSDLPDVMPDIDKLSEDENYEFFRQIRLLILHTALLLKKAFVLLGDTQDYPEMVRDEAKNLSYQVLQLPEYLDLMGVPCTKLLVSTSFSEV